MLHAKEDFVSSLVVPHIIAKTAFLLDNVLDPTSLFDELHKVLMREDTYEGFVLWCSSHYRNDPSVN